MSVSDAAIVGANISLKGSVTGEKARELLDYDPETGRLSWKGKSAQAGTLHIKGYWQVSILGRFYKAHRLAWLYVHGEWPNGDIDHLDGNRANNRISNLRDVTNAQNQQNRRRANKNSKSGILGASWDENRGLWQAHITLDRKKIHIGRFSTAEEAHAAYVAAKNKLHPYGTLEVAA